MYQFTYSYSYVLAILFCFIINTLLLIRLRMTHSFIDDRRWIANFLIGGYLYGICDLLCIILSGHVGRGLFYVLNALYFCVLAYLCYVIFLFTLEQLLGKKVGKKAVIFMAIPLYVITIINFVSYWTGWIFNVDEHGIYSRGVFFILFYLLGNIYIVGNIILCFIYLFRKKHIKFSNQPFTYSIPVFVGTLLQYVFPEIPFTCMGLTITFLVIFMNSQEYYIKQNVSAITDYKNQQSRYIEALLHDSLYFFEFDLSDGIIKEEMHRNSNFHVTKEMKITYPISYEAFNEFRSERFGMHAASYQEASYWTCEGLRKAYESGKRSLEIRYESEQLMLYWTATIILMENPVNNHVQVMYICKDVTEIKQNDKKRQLELERALVQAENASLSKSTFLFNMSHDIRTPMNAIVGFTNLAKENIDDKAKLTEYLEKIDDSNDALLSLVNNVLEMARIEKGTIPLENKARGTEDVCKSICAFFTDMMKQKDITFTSKINVKHDYVFCDESKLRQIFLNIISNAYKYTPAGGTVTVELDELPYEKEGYILLSTKVIDNGVGIAEDFIPHLFEEFSREKSTTESKIEGTGLGLSIVKKLLEMMDGSIDVESKKGKGTTFTVYIPHKIAGESDIEVEAQGDLDSSAFKGKRILLAEDNDLNAEIGITLLEANGFIVDRVSDGLECVEKLQKSVAKQYDLILMDIQMPKMDGYEATRAIRTLKSKQKARIPIIAMTANVFDEDKRNAFDAGMNDHISKPIDVKCMMRTLAKYL